MAAYMLSTHLLCPHSSGTLILIYHTSREVVAALEGRILLLIKPELILGDPVPVLDELGLAVLLGNVSGVNGVRVVWAVTPDADKARIAIRETGEHADDRPASCTQTTY
eukprot:668476-Rhodomonas_salina.2